MAGEPETWFLLPVMLTLLEGRAISEFGAFLGALPLLGLTTKGDGQKPLAPTKLSSGWDSMLKSVQLHQRYTLEQLPT